MQKNHLLNNFY